MPQFKYFTQSGRVLVFTCPTQATTPSTTTVLSICRNFAKVSRPEIGSFLGIA